MKCRVCQNNRIKKIDCFKPYTDRDWTFDVYDCSNCLIRFAVRDSNINYHEEIHSNKNSPYQFHYSVANEFKEIINDDISQAKLKLKNKSEVFIKLFEYIEGKPKSISILELGCSTGYATATLQAMGFQNAIGVDISKTAIEYAKSLFGNFYQLEIEEKKYDVIFHTGLIGCVDEPIEFLNHYLKFLSDDGVMIFNAPDVDSIKEIDELWVSTPPPDLIFLFKDKVFNTLFDKKYNIHIEKSISLVNIAIRYKNRLKKRKNNSYPRKFDAGTSNNIAKINPLIKNITLSFIRLLLKLNIVKKYSSEYGLIIKICNKKLND